MSRSASAAVFGEGTAKRSTHTSYPIPHTPMPHASHVCYARFGRLIAQNVAINASTTPNVQTIAAPVGRS